MPADDFASVLIDLDKIACKHIGADSLGFRNLSFELVRKPKIVIVKKGDPFTFGMADAEIAGDGSISVGEREICGIISRGAFVARPAHIGAFPIGNDYDFVIREGLSPHAGERFGKHPRAVVRWDDDGNERK